MQGGVGGFVSSSYTNTTAIITSIRTIAINIISAITTTTTTYTPTHTQSAGTGQLETATT